jgi:RHS repeat-associated protein
VLADQTTGYKYDRAGRLTAYGDFSQSPDYTDVTLGWDAENRLTSYSVNGQATTYAYNGYGDRYSQQVDNGAPTFYTLDYNTDLTQVLAATTNNQTTTYLTGIGEQSPNSAWSYYSTDGLGSVRQMTDAAGAVTYKASYEPYGTPFDQWPGPQAASTFGYTGESTDANSLVYLRARYYDPRLGTFLSKDPFEGVMTRSGSLNGYGYVEGNPVSYTDPSGRLPIPDPFGLVYSFTTWLLSSLPTVSDSLRSIDDPQRNPQMYEYRQGLLAGIHGWEQAAHGAATLSQYTYTAVSERNWSNLQRAIGAWGQASFQTNVEELKALGHFGLAVVLMPWNLATRSIPNFYRAISERAQGQDRFWDVILSGVMLEGDILGTYGVAKGIGIVDRINVAIENRLFGGLLGSNTNAPGWDMAEFDSPYRNGKWRGWDLPDWVKTPKEARLWYKVQREGLPFNQDLSPEEAYINSLMARGNVSESSIVKLREQGNLLRNLAESRAVRLSRGETDLQQAIRLIEKNPMIGKVNFYKAIQNGYIELVEKLPDEYAGGLSYYANGMIEITPAKGQPVDTAAVTIEEIFHKFQPEGGVHPQEIEAWGAGGDWARKAGLFEKLSKEARPYYNDLDYWIPKIYKQWRTMNPPSIYSEYYQYVR